MGVRLLVSALGALLAAYAAPCPAKPEHGRKHKDWVTQCRDVQVTEDGEERTLERCFIVQAITHTDSGQQLAGVIVGRTLAGDQPMAEISLTARLGIFIPPGMSLRVDGGEGVRFGFQFCFADVCKAVLPLTDELLARLKAGRQADITFADRQQRPITIPVSLLGFTAGFNSLLSE